jgi:alpha-D-ribose 1-methylphosphonate 5-triphosphate synthase subunit PhnH
VNAVAIPKLWQPDVQQLVFRQLLQAMAYPGERRSIHDLVDDARAAIAVLATLCDDAVSFADPHQLISSEDRGFLLGIEASETDADFIVVGVTHEPDFRPRTGTIYRPEESATVILACESLGLGDSTINMTGPGIETEVEFSVTNDIVRWLRWRNALTHYPQGVDLIFADAKEILAIPRSSQIRFSAVRGMS